MSMSNVRMVLWGALAALLVVAYQQWNLDYGKLAIAPTPAESQASGAKPGGSLGDSIPQTAPALATTPASTPQPPASAVTLSPPATANATLPATSLPADTDTTTAAPLHIVTDVLDVSINLKGGELDRADLLQYPLHKDTPNTPLRLLSAEPGTALYVVQSGLTGGAGEAAPTHLAIFTAPQSTFQLEPGADELRVPLSWSDQGLSVTKTFIFRRGQYTVELDYEVKNSGAAPRKLSPYSQILRHWEHPSRSYFDVETYSFKGPAVYDGTKSKDLNVENDTDSKYAASVTGGWLASLQHQFVTALVPPAGQPYQYQLQVKNNQYLLSATGPAVEVPAGGSATFKQEVFVGPKLQSQLAAANRNLERTVDFGVLTILAQPLFTGLNFVHKLVGNWGWSIIIVTALIKLIFYPLSQASGRSMARMRSVQPRLKQIQETFKDDREKLGRAMMELYKKEKINPLAGCLPWWCRSRCSSPSIGCCWRAWKCARHPSFCGSMICRRAILSSCCRCSWARPCSCNPV